jgi:hypothetical protein
VNAHHAQISSAAMRRRTGFSSGMLGSVLTLSGLKSCPQRTHTHRVTTRPALLEHIGRKRRHPPRNMHANSARQSPREARSRDTGAPQRETWRSYGCAAMPLRYPTSILGITWANIFCQYLFLP